MYVNASLSSNCGPSEERVPDFLRTHSAVRANFCRSGKHTVLDDCFETGGLRLRRPKSAGRCEGVLVNIAGGMTGGDTSSIDIRANRASSVFLTTQSAEKIYRSDHRDALTDISLHVEDNARMAWIPQETIIFDRARLRRTLHVNLAEDARILMHEMSVFGRAASGEHWTNGAFRDSWRIRRGKQLIFADQILLEDDVGRAMASAAAGNNARAIATILIAAKDAERSLNSVRQILSGAASTCGASAWNSLLVARFVAADADFVRRDTRLVLARLLGNDLPRIWAT